MRKPLLILNTLTFSSTQILLFTLLPLLSEKMSLSLPVIIGCFSLGSFLFLWGAPYWSSKSDFIGRDTVMTICLGGLSVSFFIMIVLINFSIPLGAGLSLMLLILSRFLYGTLASGIVPVAQLSFSDMNASGEHLSSMLSHSLALNLGRCLGPLIVLFGQNHLEDVLLGISLWTLILVSANFIYKNKTHINFKDASAPRANFSQWREATGKIFLPLVVTILFTSYTGLLHSSLGNTLSRVFSLSGLEASTLMARVLFMGSVVMIVGQIAGKLILKYKLRLTLGLGLGSLTIGATILAFMNSEIQLWVAIAFISSGIALTYPGHMALVHANYPKESMGKNIGLLASGNTIGYALGGALASALLQFNVNKVALVIVIVLCGTAYVSTQKMKL